ncbi:hypothetical protein IAU59_005709 [Kwoniella sp. CBS 9459]
MAGIKNTKTAKSGLTFPVARLQRYLKRGRYAKTILTSAAVFLAGTLEYLVAELIEMAGTAARHNKAKRIKPRYLKLAIANDEDFNLLIGKVTFADAGVIPHINRILLPKNSKSKKKLTQDTTTTTSGTVTPKTKGSKSGGAKKGPTRQPTPEGQEESFASE